MNTLPPDSVPNSIDVTAATFEAEVLAVSHQRPVLVDFWAPWCAPCRSLKPILEKLAAGSQGKFRLAKINTDENQAIAQRYGIRGIPNVKAFVNGQVVDEFTGALPESGVRAFLERLMPGPAEVLRRAAGKSVSAGDFELAEKLLREAVQLDARLWPAYSELAELLVARQAFAEADALVQTIPEGDRNERYTELVARIETWRRSSDLPDYATLIAALEANPGDVTVRLHLAERLIAGMQFEPALEELVNVVRESRGATHKEPRETARKAMLRVFQIATDETELIARYRRELAAALN